MGINYDSIDNRINKVCLPINGRTFLFHFRWRGKWAAESPQTDGDKLVLGGIATTYPLVLGKLKEWNVSSCKPCYSVQSERLTGGKTPPAYSP